MMFTKSQQKETKPPDRPPLFPEAENKIRPSPGKI
jgi:hypothetical protein